MISTRIFEGISSVGVILAVMIIVAAVETLIPLHPRGRWGRDHLGPNVALMLTTFATNLFLNAALLGLLGWAQSTHIGLLNGFAVPRLVEMTVVVLGLDFSFYVAHRAMHSVRSFWRYHSVHHSDPFVDVTTTIRQHPGESLIRYGFLAVFAIALGASPAAFGLYRVWSVLAGLLEHANVRLPRWLDGALVLFISTPNMHKIHHSRRPDQTDSNYSNITSLWDRLFSSYTPSILGTDVAYGLEGTDDRSTQTTRGLFALPFRDAGRLMRAARDMRGSEARHGS